MVFPRRSGKPKQGDASKEELVSANQKHGALMPIERPEMQQLETVTLTDEMKVRLRCAGALAATSCWH